MNDDSHADLLARLARLEAEVSALRPRLLDEAPEPARLPTGSFRIVTMRIGGDLYGLLLDSVQEVVLNCQLTRIAEAPPSVCGLLNLRGQPVPVLDLRTRLGASTTPAGLDTPLLVARTSEGLLGLLVNRVLEVVDLQSAQVSAVDLALGDRPEALGVAEIGNRFVQLLDASRLAREEEVAAWSDAVPENG